VVGYLQEGLSNIEIESEYVTESDHNTEYADAVVYPRSLPITGFY
jgi:hypothetical protein